MNAAHMLASLILAFYVERWNDRDQRDLPEFLDAVAQRTSGEVGILADCWAADLRAEEDGWISGTGLLDREQRRALYMAGLISYDAPGFVGAVDQTTALKSAGVL